MSRFCRPFARLVGARQSLPAAPFEFGWAEQVGCNSMRCDRCGEPVAAEILPAWRSTSDPADRRYACGCRRHYSDEIDYASDPEDDLYAAGRSGSPAEWVCVGHPDISLPTVLDGVRLAADTDWETLLMTAIRQPPVNPPDWALDRLAGHRYWLVRLHHLLAAERSLLQQGIIRLSGSDDPQLATAARDLLRLTNN